MKCGHAACTCEVAEGQTYCSQHCEEMGHDVGTGADGPCGCGHPACEAA